MISSFGIPVINNCYYQHYKEALSSPFLVRDVECKISSNESDDGYLEGDDGTDDDDDDADAEDVPSTLPIF